MVIGFAARAACSGNSRENMDNKTCIGGRSPSTNFSVMGGRVKREGPYMARRLICFSNFSQPSSSFSYFSVTIP